MAVASGTNGSLSFGSGGYATAVTAWTLDVAIAELDITSWDDASSGVIWREFIAGIREYTGTITARLDPAQTVLADIGSELSATFDVDTEQGTGGLGYTGDIIITGITPSVEMEGVSEVSFTFRGAGELTAVTS
jgi:hypothetical protein